MLALLAGACGLWLFPPQTAAEGVFGLTPMIGYRAGGRVAAEDGDARHTVDDARASAVALRLQREPTRDYELYYSRQRSRVRSEGVDLRTEYLHVGGVAEWPQSAYVPFASGGIGATRFSVSGLGSHIRPSASVGGGIMLPLSDALRLRLEARLHGSLTDGDRRIFCGTIEGEGRCLFRQDGDSFVQIEALIGLAYRF